MHQDKDRSAKWLLSHHGDAILKLAGITGFNAWKHLPCEIVASRRTLDGLLEVQFPDRTQPTLVLIEIESYADSDADRQVFEDIMLVALEYCKIPEVISLVMKPKGLVRVTGRFYGSSPNGTTRIEGHWPVVCLWDFEAYELLAYEDIGLIPWVPLTRAGDDPESVIRTCIERIVSRGKAEERSALLAVTYILANFAYPGRSILSLFGGAEMILDLETKSMLELEEAWKKRNASKFEIESLTRHSIEILEERFGGVPYERAISLQSISDMGKLRKLHRFAATCPTLDDFFVEAAKQ